MSDFSSSVASGDSSPDDGFRVTIQSDRLVPGVRASWHQQPSVCVTVEYLERHLDKLAFVSLDMNDHPNLLAEAGIREIHEGDITALGIFQVHRIALD